MRANPVRKKLAAGEVAIGTMVFEFNTTGIGRIIGAAGVEFAVYDMEHTGWSIETIRMLMATARAAETVPMVRVPATQYHLLARPLDVGAMGLMVPMVEDAEQARLIVQSAKYPPQGRRGCAFGIAHDDYAGGDVLMKMQSANDEIMLIAQIETARGVENVDGIAAVDGIDCIWIGHFDLTASLGIPAQFDHPAFQDAVDAVIAAGQRHGKAVGIMASSVANAQDWIARGFRAIAYSGDLWLYQQALAEGIAALRDAVTAVAGSSGTFPAGQARAGNG
ncbi:MAG: aldolase [Chloroflexota bacterium]